LRAFLIVLLFSLSCIMAAAPRPVFADEIVPTEEEEVSSDEDEGCRTGPSSLQFVVPLALGLLVFNRRRGGDRA
jgi:hypothetical protein